MKGQADAWPFHVQRVKTAITANRSWRLFSTVEARLRELNTHVIELKNDR